MYNDIYKTYFVRDNKNFSLSIKEKDYSGSTKSIKLKDLSLKNKLKSFNDHIVATTLNFKIFNDFDNFFEFDSLIKSENYNHIVELKNETDDLIIFSGFIENDTISTKYNKYNSIDIQASLYLKKLEKKFEDSLKEWGKTSLIDLLQICLNKDNILQKKIRTNISVKTENLENLLENTYLDNRVFHKNKEELESKYEILEKLLKAFNLYLYSYNNYYYIEQFYDLNKTSNNYLEYDIMSNNSTEINENDDIIYLSENNLQNTNIKYENGIKEYEVKINYNVFDNLMNEDYNNDITYIDNATSFYNYKFKIYTESDDFEYDPYPDTPFSPYFNNNCIRLMKNMGDENGFVDYLTFSTPFQVLENNTFSLSYQILPTALYKYTPYKYATSIYIRGAGWINEDDSENYTIDENNEYLFEKNITGNEIIENDLIINESFDFNIYDIIQETGKKDIVVRIYYMIKDYDGDDLWGSVDSTYVGNIVVKMDNHKRDDNKFIAEIDNNNEGNKKTELDYFSSDKNIYENAFCDENDDNIKEFTINETDFFTNYELIIDNKVNLYAENHRNLSTTFINTVKNYKSFSLIKDDYQIDNNLYKDYDYLMLVDNLDFSNQKIKANILYYNK